MHFSLKGITYFRSRAGVQVAMRGIKPDIIRKYYTSVNGKQYPIKQVISVITGLGLSEFGTVDAGPLIKRLGFILKERR